MKVEGEETSTSKFTTNTRRTAVQIQYDIAIIENVKQHPALYNLQKHGLVGNKIRWNSIYKKMAAMKELHELDFNAESIRSRWCSMRRTFKITYEKIKSGIDIQPYVYYNLMNYLEPIYNKKNDFQPSDWSKYACAFDSLDQEEKKDYNINASGLILSKTEHVWTEIEKIMFLKIVERFPEIYNQYDPNFRNFVKKRKSCTVVINLMKLPYFDVTARLYSIRREVYREVRNGSDDKLFENPLVLTAKFLIECNRRKEMIEAFKQTYSTPRSINLFLSENQINKLLILAKEFPEIWNESHDDYKRTDQRMLAYTAIQSQLEAPEIREVAVIRKFHQIIDDIGKKIKKGEDALTIANLYPGGDYLIKHQQELNEVRKTVVIPWPSRKIGDSVNKNPIQLMLDNVKTPEDDVMLDDEENLPQLPAGTSVSLQSPLPTLPCSNKTMHFNPETGRAFKRGHDTREFLRILEDYPVLWQHKNAEYLQDTLAIDKAAAAMLERYTINKYDKKQLLSRYSRARRNLVKAIKKYEPSGDDMLYYKLSSSVFPNYLIHHVNNTYGLGLSKELLQRLEIRPIEMNTEHVRVRSIVNKTKPNISYNTLVPKKRIKMTDISNENIQPEVDEPERDVENQDLPMNSNNCRICLQETTKECKNLVSTFYDGMSYQEIYTKCTGRKYMISQVDYPMKICAMCENELLSCYEFLQICSYTDTVLEKIHKTKNNKPAEAVPLAKDFLQLIYDKDTTLEVADIELLTEADLDDQINQQLETIISTDVVQTKAPETTVVCHICGEMEKQSRINEHILKHTAPEEFTCNECKRQYKTKQNLLSHVKKAHVPKTEKTVYNCGYCPKKFNSYSNKYHHFLMKHMQSKKHRCKLCPFATVKKHQLLNHLVTHDEYKVYKFGCEMCDSVFTLKTRLADHQKHKHSNVNRITCDVCGQGFKSMSHMKTHYLTHTGEKDYVCPVCSHAFAQCHVLRAHVAKKHPDHQLPPKGTVMSAKALKRIARQAELDKAFVKIDI